MKKVRILTVGQVSESDNMSQLAKAMLRRINQTEYAYLKLYVYDNYIDQPLEHILEEGMYEYKSYIPFMVEMLEQLNDIARPILFDADDIVSDNIILVED